MADSRSNSQVPSQAPKIVIKPQKGFKTSAVAKRQSLTPSKLRPGPASTYHREGSPSFLSTGAAGRPSSQQATAEKVRPASREEGQLVSSHETGQAASNGSPVKQPRAPRRIELDTAAAPEPLKMQGKGLREVKYAGAVSPPPKTSPRLAPKIVEKVSTALVDATQKSGNEIRSKDAEVSAAQQPRQQAQRAPAADNGKRGPIGGAGTKELRPAASPRAAAGGDGRKGRSPSRDAVDDEEGEVHERGGRDQKGRKRSRSRSHSRSRSRSRDRRHKRSRDHSRKRSRKDRSRSRDRYDRRRDRDDRDRDRGYSRRDRDYDRYRERDRRDRDRDRGRYRSRSRSWSRSRSRSVERRRDGGRGDRDRERDRYGERRDRGGSRYDDRDGRGARGREVLVDPVAAAAPKQPDPLEIRNQIAWAQDLHWPQAAKDLPPSPDISDCIKTITTALRVEYDPSNPYESCQQLRAKAEEAEATFRHKEAHVWEVEQAQQHALLAALDGEAPNPFDSVNLPPPASAVFHLPHYLAPGSPPALADFPPPVKVSLRPIDPEIPPADPRLKYETAYQAVAEWARRPLNPPHFAMEEWRNAMQGAANGGRPKPIIKYAYSWASSPKREQGEPEVNQPGRGRDGREEGRRERYAGEGQIPPRPPGTYPTYGDNVLDAPAAPKHDDMFGRSVLRSQGPAAPTASVPHAMQTDQSLEIEEGHFELIMPPGERKKEKKEEKEDGAAEGDKSRRKPGPFYNLLGLVKSGKIPAGWPVYRASDRLWLPLSESVSLEELEGRGKEALVRAQRYGQVKEPIITAWESPADGPHIDDSGGALYEDWFNQTAAEIEVERVVEKEKKKGPQPKWLHSATNSYLAGNEERKQGIDTGDNPLESSFEGPAAVKDAEERLKTSRELGGAAFHYAAPPAHIMSAVQGSLLSNTEGIVKIAQSVLQTALRNVIAKQQAASGGRKR